MAAQTVRLTELAHGGGCGCKLSPIVLRELLSGLPTMKAFPNLLVGLETADDAAVYQINDDQAIVATTDFFTPIVDDPFDFGRVAAANALSDVYAMGGRPILALAILGMPLGKIAPQAVAAILAGGAAICQGAGVPVAGGHSIDAPEPIYGLAVVGLVHPNRVLRNSGARPGDHLVLSKPIGVGVASAALKSGQLDQTTQLALYSRLIETTTRLNAVGEQLAQLDCVTAMTDVTGFGLLGHTLEICRASNLGARLELNSVPLLEGAADLARAGYRTGAATRNWDSYGAEVRLPPHLNDWRRDLICDPQTSGGLLISMTPDGVEPVLELLRAAAFPTAAVIGEMRSSQSGVEVV